MVVIGDFRIGVLAREDFVINKRAAARTNDLLDLALLEEADRD